MWLAVYISYMSVALRRLFGDERQNIRFYVACVAPCVFLNLTNNFPKLQVLYSRSIDALFSIIF